ncbi:MAG: chloride channel protein [Ruminococcaceae bacterium]|nr:chloride channel protein [Oscillospiraceae bacterium]
MKNITFKRIFFGLLKRCILGVLIGTLGGLVGACFAHLLSFVTRLREAGPWLILLLPVGGIATVLLYRVFGMHNFGGTNEIIHCLEDKRPIRVIAAPLIFISTAITHLLGGSAGREGAALQLGGAGASALSNILRLKENDRTIVVLSGMSAVFSGVFGTPLTAAFFVLEFTLATKVVSLAILPCFISAVISEKVSFLMGAAGETFHLSNITTFTFNSIAKIIVLSIGLSVLGRVMCFFFNKSELWAKKLISNPLLRSVIGAVVIIMLTIIVGDMRYNGSGMSMAIGAVKGNANWFDFILKIVFTAITLAAGFKGGEIVPTFCVGATFGCVFGSILGLDPGFSAALGLIGLFCCATNSPISAIFLGIEMFGFTTLPYYLLICLILWPLSVNKGLFENRFFKSPLFSKTKNNEQ